MLTPRRLSLVLLLLAIDKVFPYGITFIVMGDWGSQLGPQNPQFAPVQQQVAAQMGIIAAQYDISFVVGVGDNFYETGVNSTNDPHWKACFVDVYTAASLQKPWYQSLGNHDYQGIVQAQLEYDGDPRWNLPSRNYTVTIPIDDTHNATLVILDTTPFIQDYYQNPEMAIQLQDQHWQQQFSWFENTLEETKTDWIIVFAHHPVYSSEGGFVELQQYIKPVLEKNNVNVYFSGHDHNLQHWHINSVDYFISGAAARVITSNTPDVSKSESLLFYDVIPGFVVVNLTYETAHTIFYAVDGSILHEAFTPNLNLAPHKKSFPSYAIALIIVIPIVVAAIIIAIVYKVRKSGTNKYFNTQE